MSQNDGELPEDLREIGERLSAARFTPSRLELDELAWRVHDRRPGGGSAPRRARFAAAWRTHFAAVLLTLALVTASGVGVVLASQLVGGGPNTYQSVSLHGDAYASCFVEHPGGWSSSYGWKTKRSTLHVTVLWNCKDLTAHISSGDPTSYRWGSGPWLDAKSTSYTATAPGGTSAISVTADGSTHTVPFTW